MQFRIIIYFYSAPFGKIHEFLLMLEHMVCTVSNMLERVK
jgi:hypothetical protein